jgi:hypothetical protein
MANFRNVVVLFGEILDNNEISKKIIKGCHFFKNFKNMGVKI